MRECARSVTGGARTMRRSLSLLALTLVLAAPAAVSAPTASTQTRVAIFYYPWWGNPAYDGAYLHWDADGHVPPTSIASEYFPARGLYSSADPAIIHEQLTEIRAAGIDTIIVSWWGWGSIEDARLPAVVAEARRDGLRVAIHLEPYPGRSIESVRADVTHLTTLGVRDFYVYHPQDFPAFDWLRLLFHRTSPELRFFAETDHVGWASRAGFDGVYTYDIVSHGASSFGRLCQQARASGMLCAPSVGPGYDARAVRPDDVVEPRDDGATYDDLWRAALRASPDEVTITSYNEWHEGTQIEEAMPVPGYENYNGAWGLHGLAARHAYLDRTAHWSTLFRQALARRG
jgi:glycoprotein endo-alpha-1,2-mannosidase